MMLLGVNANNRICNKFTNNVLPISMRLFTQGKKKDVAGVHITNARVGNY